jgi:hypothetical protein
MDALVLVHLVQKAPDLRVGVGEIAVLGQCHLLLLDRAPQPLDKDVVQRPAAPIPADLDVGLFEAAGVGGTGELHALIGVEDDRLALA